MKMVHNGIEYGLMQAYAEGFDIFRNATSKEVPEEHRYDLNLADIAEVWRRGSVVSSWLLDLTAMALHALQYTGFVRIRRGPMDHPGRDRRGGSDGRLIGSALYPLPFSAGTYFRGKNAFSHAPEVRAGPLN